MFLNNYIVIFLIILTINYSDKLSAGIDTIYHTFDIGGITFLANSNLHLTICIIML